MSGWAYLNPDSGMEWRPQHPVQSGECDDAESIETMTLAEFERRFPRAAAPPGTVKCGTHCIDPLWCIQRQPLCKKENANAA